MGRQKSIAAQKYYQAIELFTRIAVLEAGTFLTASRYHAFKQRRLRLGLEVQGLLRNCRFEAEDNRQLWA